MALKEIFTVTMNYFSVGIHRVYLCRDMFSGKLSYHWLCKATFDSIILPITCGEIVVLETCKSSQVAFVRRIPSALPKFEVISTYSTPD